MVADLICCKGTDCPDKQTCARFTPYHPDEHPVFWMEEVPFEQDAGCCPSFVHSNQLQLEAA